MTEPDYHVEFHPLDNPATWEAEFAAQGITALEAMLARRAAFADYLMEHGHDA